MYHQGRNDIFSPIISPKNTRERTKKSATTSKAKIDQSKENNKTLKPRSKVVMLSKAISHANLVQRKL